MLVRESVALKRTDAIVETVTTNAIKDNTRIDPSKLRALVYLQTALTRVTGKQTSSDSLFRF